MSCLQRMLAAGAMQFACCAAFAQVSAASDPTRPPAILSAPQAQGGVQVPDQPVVQSILVSERAGGRRIAVIDGKTLRQGERLGGAVVETIRPSEVVLRSGTKRTILKLYRPLGSVAAVQP